MCAQGTQRGEHNYTTLFSKIAVLRDNRLRLFSKTPILRNTDKLSASQKKRRAVRAQGAQRGAYFQNNIF